jgi:hypothetical protein
MPGMNELEHEQYRRESAAILRAVAMLTAMILEMSGSGSGSGSM